MAGWGKCVPEKVVTNDDLAAVLDTSDAWIVERTGIRQRHIAADGQATASLALGAARAALERADADPRDLDLIIVATMTPDHPMPAAACQVQNALGAARAGAFDLNAGCSGFVYALAMGQAAIEAGSYRSVLVIGADTMSAVVNWQDRATAVLFGDGAGAVLLRATDEEHGVLASLLGADGAGDELLMIPAGGSAQRASPETVAAGLHTLQMNGRQVYRFAARVLPEAAEAVARDAGLSLDDVDWIIPHQANARIIEAAAQRLQMPLERFVINVDAYGNTSAASVPIALCEAADDGRLQPGQHVVLVGFGAGLTWAAAAVRWAAVKPEVQRATLHRLWRELLYRWAGLRTGLVRGINRLVGRLSTLWRRRKHGE
ncbi:MAG: beta-ketoacyl-ACP synthase III [Anaerolineae bacterium]